MNDQIVPRGEVMQPSFASSGQAIQIQAVSLMRFESARRNPRDWDNIRVRILKECARPAFATMCMYGVKRGNSMIQGFSVRFAECVARHVCNTTILESVVADEPDRRIVRISVLDVETNTEYAQDIYLDKVVERSYANDREILSQRTNSKGGITFIVRATEDELKNKKNAEASKAMRNCILRLVPGDILEDAKVKIQESISNEAKQDPQAFAKRIMDGFAAIGIDPSQIKEYVGKPTLSALTTGEVDDLRSVLQGIKDGELTWAGALAARDSGDRQTAEAPEPPKGARSKVAEKVKQLAPPKAAEVPVVPADNPST